MSQNTRFVIRAGQAIRGTTTVPGDKSISHRSVMFASLANGISHVRNWLAAGDTEATLQSVRTLGVNIERHDTNTLTIHGGNYQAPSVPLDFVNAGTGIRLMSGVMVGQPFPSILDGSAQLRRRPMKRVTKPLGMMGAKITDTNGCAPLHIEPAELVGIQYDMPEASGQVKSAVLLAGLFAKGETVVIQPGPARDHTELMLRSMGADLTVDGNVTTVKAGGVLQPFNITVPGDFSSAAFLMVAASIVPDSELLLQGINLNPTRTGLLEVLQAMNASITVTETGTEAGEPIGDLLIKTADLRGVEVGGEMVVRMIDEFPVMMVAALCASGRTVVRDAQELRVKETDRLAVMTAELTKMGAKIEETADGFIIEGRQQLHGATVDGHDDHRIAMSMTVASLVAQGTTTVLDAKCAGDSFPGFGDLLTQIGADLAQEVEE